MPSANNFTQHILFLPCKAQYSLLSSNRPLIIVAGGDKNPNVDAVDCGYSDAAVINKIVQEIEACSADDEDSDMDESFLSEDASVTPDGAPVSESNQFFCKTFIHCLNGPQNLCKNGFSFIDRRAFSN